MSNEEVYSTCGEIYGGIELSDLEVGNHYYSGNPEQLVPSKLLGSYTAFTIVEQLIESAYEEVGELAGSGNISLSEEDEKALQKMIGAFLDDKLKVSCWKAVNIKEQVMEG